MEHVHHELAIRLLGIHELDWDCAVELLSLRVEVFASVVAVDEAHEAGANGLDTRRILIGLVFLL